MSPRLVVIPRSSARADHRTAPPAASPRVEEATPEPEQEKRELERMWWWAMGV
jgi:hypothetical protein